MSSGYFKKQTPHAHEEKYGLEELSRIGILRYVKVVAADDHAITLERLTPARPTVAFWRRFGTELARHHAVTGTAYGFGIDNHCGPTEQPNPEVSCAEISWADYFIRFRLEHHLAHSRLKSIREIQTAFAERRNLIHQILSQVTEPPSLVHGDLWSGNFICVEEDGAQVPVLIDPAPYWGHRETDLAMSELFGGFAPDFYQAYEQEFPLAPGYKNRKKVYQLYHLLNHSIIFGSSYYAQTLRLFTELDFT